jgi:predicted dehydrogenase
MKFLIAGLGSIGRRHLRNLIALGQQDILLYRTHLAANQSPIPDYQSGIPDLSSIPVETDLQAALAHHPQAVIVSNPTALHLDVAIPAALQGCHLLLEKPLSHSMARIAELEAALAHGGGQVLVGYQFRYHPGLQKITELLSTQAIGRPLSFHAHWGEYLPGWHPWEDYRAGYSARPELGGGVVLTLSHPIDYLRWMLGEVEALWAFTAQASDLELAVEDTADIGLRFASGVSGSLHLDYNQQPPAHRLEIVGTHGTLTWEAASGAVSWYRAGDAQSPQSGAWQTFSPPPGFERNDLFLAQMRHFIDVAEGKIAPRCSLQDGIRALEIALAALDSQAAGHLVRF